MSKSKTRLFFKFLYIIVILPTLVWIIYYVINKLHPNPYRHFGVTKSIVCDTTYVY